MEERTRIHRSRSRKEAAASIKRQFLFGGYPEGRSRTDEVGMDQLHCGRWCRFCMSKIDNPIQALRV